MRVYKFRCGYCGYESQPFEDVEDCRKWKEAHEKACREPVHWSAKAEPPKPLPTEIIYV